MRKIKPIRTDLFHFATLRGPQLIKDEIKKNFYIFHPDADRSLFLTRLTGSASLDELRIVLQNNIGSFEPFVRKGQVRATNTPIYDLSSFLMENRNTLSIERVENLANNYQAEQERFAREEAAERQAAEDAGKDPDKVTPKFRLLSIEEELVLWDNIIYQVLENESEEVFQACVQMLITHNFMEKILQTNNQEIAQDLIQIPRTPSAPNATESLKLYYRRLANAKVVIPKFWSSIRNEHVANYLSGGETRETEQAFKAALTRKINKNIDRQKKELKQVEQQALTNYSQAVKIANNNYEAALESARIEIREDFPTIEEDELEIKLAERNISIEQVEFPAVFNNEAIDEQLSPDSIAFLNEANNRVLNGHILQRKLSNRKKKATKKMQKSQSRRRQITYHGVPLNDRPDSPGAFTFGFYFPDDKTQGEAYLLLKKGNPADEVVSFEYKLSLIKADDIFFNSDEEAPEIVQSDNNYIFLRLFKNQVFSKKDLGSYSFNGQFTMLEMRAVDPKDPFPAFETIEKAYSIHFSSHIYRNMVKGIYIDNDLLGQRQEIYGVNKVGVIDYRKVEQEVCCYEPGEISHIENVMAREFKERSTRNFTGTELQEEQSSELEVENKTDEATTSRNEMQAEVSNVLNSEISRNTGFNAGTTVKYGTETAGFSLDLGLDMQFANSNSSSTTNSTALTKAEEITNKILQRVVTKTAVKRTSIMRKEFEENTRHGFDNREGNKNISGVYRWIDKIYTNRLINYGKRLTYEFMIPEPAALYKNAVLKAIQLNEIIPEEGNVMEDTSPTLKSPEQYNIFRDAEDLSMSDISTALADYRSLGAVVQDIFDFDETIDDIYSDTIVPLVDLNGYRRVDPISHPNIFVVPDGAVAVRLVITGVIVGREFLTENHYADFSSKGVPANRFSFVRKDFEFEYTLGSRTMTYPTPLPSGSLVPLTVSGNGFNSYRLSGRLVLEPSADARELWVQESYDKLKTIYTNLLSEQVAQNQSDLEAEGNQEAEEEKAPVNPAFYREIEQRELKRIAIEMLIQPFKGWHALSPSKEPGKGLVINWDCPTVDGTGTFKVPHVNQTAYLQEYTSMVKFFEQAFDWSILSYTFYPYYWSDECKWRDLLLTTNDDQQFQDFLRSGVARLLLPVRPGFESAVKYYMVSGRIWNGKDIVVDAEDDLYISLVEEMQTVEGVVEESWETRVPTTLTAIQNSTISLNAQGLPCCQDEATMEFTIESSLTRQLKGENPQDSDGSTEDANAGDDTNTDESNTP